MTYADKLKGRLLLYYGTADNNVHPSNTLQLIKALQQAGQELRGAGRARPGALERQPAADDGVLHREPGHAPAADAARETDGASR